MPAAQKASAMAMSNRAPAFDPAPCVKTRPPNPKSGPYISKGTSPAVAHALACSGELQFAVRRAKRARLLACPPQVCQNIRLSAMPTVFISSTSEDLKPYRDAARDAAIGAGLLPKMMEYFVATGGPSLPECLRLVSEA